MTEIWTGLLEALGAVLRFFHDLTEGLVGEYSWTAAIVLLTLAVRIVLLPLAIKQFRSMQAMQALRPQMKRIQGKYKTDRSMARTDPEKYREKRQKQQEELMALYKEHNVNPASSCLPLVAQMPIFIALFSVLRSPDVIPELATAPFIGSILLQDQASTGGIITILLLVFMALTTYVQQKQMMGRNAAVQDDQAMQQQKLMLYIMPGFLAVLGWSLPVGVLVYWVTTNLWQVVQGWYMLREVSHTSPNAGTGNAKSADTPKGNDAGARDDKKKADGEVQDDKKKADGEAQKDAGGGAKRSSARDAARGNGKRSPSGPRGSGAKRSAKQSSKGNAAGNGHRSGKPGRMSKNQNKTGDKRR